MCIRDSQNTSVRQYGEELKGYFLELQADERYNSITAVQNGDAYIMPRGLSNWNGDTELGLGVITMAKIMYPDRFADIDVWELAQDFYSTFVGIEITEEEMCIRDRPMAAISGVTIAAMPRIT